MFLEMPWSFQTAIENALAAFTAAQRAKAIRDLTEARFRYAPGSPAHTNIVEILEKDIAASK